MLKEKIIKKSTVRLKVRNIDERQVTNDDLKVSLYINNYNYFEYLETLYVNW